MITDQVLTNSSKPSSGQKPTNLQRRRTLIGGALAALLLPFLPSGRLMAEEEERQANDPFILLLTGAYQPVPAASGQGNLGLNPNTLNLDDGSYSKTKIYPIFGIRGSRDQDKAIGNFFVQLAGNLCAYELPGGAIAMQFLDVPPPLSNPNSLGYNNYSTIAHPDGMGGQFLEGTFELTILEATGIYSAFAGGHNHMVARTHALANGSLDEFCFCNISQYQFP